MAPNRLPRSGRVELTLGLLALAGVVAAGVALAARRTTPVEPGLVVDPADLDFGTAWEQPAFRHTLTVTNPTGRPVRVADVQTGCGCTTVEPKSFTVPSGGRQELTANLNLTGRAGSGRVGSFGVELRPLIAHQPPGSRTTWALKGDVRRNPIEPSEPSVDFGDEVIVGESAPTREIEVALAERGFDGLRAEVTGDAGSARVEPAGEGRWRVEVAPVETLPPGRFEFLVRLTATRQQGGPLPSKDIRVTGIARHDIAPWPDTVNFGPLAIGEAGQEYVVLASHAGRPFEVTHIEAPEGVLIKPAAEQLGDGSRTFVVEQRAAKTGHQTGRAAFYVAPSGSSAGGSGELVLSLETAYYGTAAQP